MGVWADKSIAEGGIAKNKKNHQKAIVGMDVGK
jgi:hypothetical protein